MNHGGDAAEQIVRMSLHGVEVIARITGTAAKEIALFLLAAIRSQDKGGNMKLKGKERLSSMLKSGKPLEIFSVKEGDLQKFSQAAKQYGIVYCALRNAKNSPDGLCDIMVKADDAPKISRIVERFHFATVDKAKIESEIVAQKAGRKADAGTGDAPQAPDLGDTDKLVDDLLGTQEGKTAPERRDAAPDTAHGAGRGEEAKDNRPLAENGGEPPKNRPSEPISENAGKSTKGILSRPSVKEELREIKATRAGLAAQKAKEADAPRRDAPAADIPKSRMETTHKQPQGGRLKIKRNKESR